MKLFVYANNDIECEYGLVRKNEIGLVDKNAGKKYHIMFASKCGKVVAVDKQRVSLFDPKETGDLFDNKVCNVCNRLLDVNLFQKNQNGKDNRTVRRPSCLDCRAVIDGAGMTAEDTRRMNKIKPHMVIWTCPICKKTTIPGLTSKVVCDHDHKTGRPRAWICDSCNTGLGRFKDDIGLLKSAIKYLENN